MGETYRRTVITATLHSSTKKLYTAKYSDSPNENLVQSIQNLRLVHQKVHLSRTMTLSTQQEWLIDNSVNVIEWPSQSLGLNPIKYFWRNLKMPIQPNRAWKVKRWRVPNAEVQSLLHHTQKDVRLERFFSYSKYWVKGMNSTYFSLSFLIKLQSCQFFCLLCHYIVCSVDWCEKK